VTVVVNDVHSKLNASVVADVVPVDSLDSIRAALARSERERIPVIAAGGRHSMGGQQFCAGGLVLDTRPLARVLSFDSDRGLVEVEAGLQWPQLLAFLRDTQRGEEEQWAFRQKQTGADRLSIGGAVSANVHGRVLTRPPLVDDLVAETVLSEPVAAVLPAGHPLAARAELELAELAGEPWVLTTRSSWPPWHRSYDEDFARAGFAPRIVERGTSVQHLLALVAAGVGVTRLALSSRSLRGGGVVFVPLTGDETQVVLARRPQHAPPALAPFAAVVREVAREVDPVTAG
jgi:FAD/FMN-containing dehydrogenase